MSEISELMKKERYSFEDLLTITRILRSENGCPWDREQDHQSIRSCLIEETYEVVEAIDTSDADLLQEELGDLLFQIVFHACLEQEKSVFDMGDVIDGISKKMIHRHPHVFGNIEVADSAEVLKNWESIKTEEKQRNSLSQKLRAIPPMLPALMRAAKVTKKIGQEKGHNARELLSVMETQIQIAQKDIEALDPQNVIGDLLMSLIRLSLCLDVDAEQALSQKTDDLIEKVAAEGR